MNTILFDLDGTLLPMDIDVFIKVYFKALGKKFYKLGYDAELCVKSVLAGTKAMYKNDGSKTNEQCFWDTFETLTNIKRNECEPQLDDFYRNEFPNLQYCDEICPSMIEAVHILKQKGYRLILATNPLFPPLATKARIKWAKLDESDFDFITTYDNCCYTKPNLAYYKEILEKLNVSFEDCMMVGNDALEDGAVQKLGIPLYLVKDYLIHRDDSEISSTWFGSSQDFLAFVYKLDEVK